MGIKTNHDYWQELSGSGDLHAYFTDGAPEGFWQSLLGAAYPIMIFGLMIVTIFAYKKLKTSEKQFKTIFWGVGLTSIVGWSWGFWMLHHDPFFPGWIFPPWAVTGIEFLLPLEDWVFYPACTTLFYIIYRKIKVTDESWNRTWLRRSIIGFYSGLILFSLFFTELCGKSVSLMFVLPGVLLFYYARKEINLKKFVLFQIILMAINTIWDWWAVSWMHNIPGMSWASQWIYLSVNESGEYVHSSIFLDYSKHAWAWIFNNPVENTPYLGFAGGILDYSIFAACDKFFYGKKSKVD